MTQSFADPGMMPGSGGDIHRQVDVDLSANVTGYSSGVQQAIQDTNALATALGAVAQQADSLSKRAGKTLMHFSVGDFAALSGATAVASRFESQLATLNATAAVTGSSMPALKKQISGVFSDFPVWRAQIVQLAQAISNLGVTKPTDIGSLTRSYTKLGAATGESSEGLASGGIQLARQMGNTDPAQIDKYNNALLTLSKNAGVSASSINEFSQALAPFARQAGIGEAAVLGIATAFQKAGADGTYAANAFNQITQEIQQMEKTGSPGLSKYSSFLGMSNQQFKGMSGQDQITSIFEKISKGGAQASQFVDTLPGGQRTLRAVQAVSQTGDLRSMIAMAQGSSQDTKNLDKGSEAALHGLGDAVTGVRNEFTELATILGDPLLAPLTKLVSMFGDAVGAVNSLLKAMGPLPTIAMAVAGAVAVPGAIGLAHSGLAAGAGLARASLGSNSGWRTVMREGRQVGQNMAGGMTREDAVAMTTLGKQQLPAHLQALFDQQIGAGQRGGSKLGQNPFLQAFQAGRAGNTGSAASKAQQAAQKAGQAAGAAAGKIGQLDLFDTLGNVAAWATEGQTDPMEEQDKAAADRKWARRRRGEDVNEGRSGWSRTGRAIRRLPWTAAEALGDVGGAAARSVRGMVPEGMPGGGAVRAGLTAASGAGRAFGALSSAAGSVASLAMGPVGLAAGIGIPLVTSIVDQIKKEQDKPRQVAEALGGAQKYDQVLDSTSTNLAKFGGAVDAASDRLLKFANTPLKDLTSVTAEDIGTVAKGDYQIADQSLSDIVKSSGGDKKAISAYISSMGVQAGDLQGDRFTKIKQDLLSTMGVSRSGDVQDIMSGIAAQAGQAGGLNASANYDALSTLASKQSGDQFKNVLGPAFAGIQAGTQNAGQAGELPRLADMLRAGGQAAGPASGGQIDRMKTISAMLNQYTGVDEGEFQNQVAAAARDLGTTSKGRSGGADIELPFGNAEDAGRVMAEAFSRTLQGKSLMEAAGITKEQLAAGVSGGVAMPSASATDTRLTDLAARGPLGASIAGIDSVGRSVAAPGQVATASQATRNILDTARQQAGGDTGKAELELRKLADASGGANDALGQLLLAAADAAAGLGSLTAATQTVPQNAITVATNANNLRGSLTPDSSAETVAASGQADQQAQQAGVGLLQYSRGLVERGRAADKSNRRAQEDNARQIQLTNESYGRQIARSEEDFSRQRARSERNFQTSSLRASEDYERQRARQIQEFGIQAARAEEDYNRQRARQMEDFHTSQSRAEEEYEKGRLRQLEDFATSANRAEEDYQTSRARTIADAQISERRSQMDFDQSQHRAQIDYNLQRARSLEDYHTSQARATADFNQQMARQAEDAAKSIYDPFARIQRQGTASAASVVRNLGQQNRAMTKQLTQLQQARDMGLSADAIKALNLADPKNAQQLDSMIKGFSTNPNLIKQTNAEVTERMKASKALTTSQYSTEYSRQVEDFKKSQTRADEDMKKGLGRSEADFTKSMARSMLDFTKGISRARIDLNKGLARSATDYAKSVRRSEQDLSKSMVRSAEDFAKQTEHANEDLYRSMTRSADDFSLSVQHSNEDFSRSLQQASDDFSLSQQRAAQDQATALSDMAADFATTEARAAQDHATALDNMAIAYKTQQDRAAEDLKDSFREFSGGFNDVMTEMTSQATGAMQQYAPEAAAAYLAAIQQVGIGVSQLVNVPGVTILIGNTNYQAGTGWTNPGGAANNPQPTASNSSSSGGTQGYSEGRHNSFPGYADGGISLNAQLAMIGEAGPELHLPLNSRGEDFMANLIAKSLARGITAAVSSTDATASSTTNTNTISFAGADIQVVASDPNQMARELEAKAKLKRLTSPN